MRPQLLEAVRTSSGERELCRGRVAKNEPAHARGWAASALGRTRFGDEEDAPVCSSLGAQQVLVGGVQGRIRKVECHERDGSAVERVAEEETARVDRRLHLERGARLVLAAAALLGAGMMLDARLVCLYLCCLLARPSRARSAPARALSAPGPPNALALHDGADQRYDARTSLKLRTADSTSAGRPEEDVRWSAQILLLSLQLALTAERRRVLPYRLALLLEGR